jgi:hypothetical protein
LRKAKGFKNRKKEAAVLYRNGKKDEAEAIWLKIAEEYRRWRLEKDKRI